MAPNVNPTDLLRIRGIFVVLKQELSKAGVLFNLGDILLHQMSKRMYIIDYFIIPWKSNVLNVFKSIYI